MNILYITSLFPCWSESFILSEIIEAEKKGINVTILSLKPPYEKVVHEKAKPYLKKTVYSSNFFNILLTNLLFFAKNKKFYLNFLKNILECDSRAKIKIREIIVLFITIDLSKKVNWKGIEHIHAHWATFPALSAMLLSRLHNIPYTFTAHAHDIYLDKAMLRRKIESAKKVVTISDFNKKYLTNLYGQEIASRINVIRCGIDASSFKFRYNVEGNGKIKTIISVGRLCDIKGFEYLIEAMRILKESSLNNGNIRCIIVGEGENKRMLNRLIEKYGLKDSIYLMGALTQDKVRDVINNGNLFVLPSVETKEGNKDGIPVVLMEAMASGIPVVTTNVSGLPEIAVHMHTAFVVPPRDAQSLATAINKMLSDKEIALNLRENARRLVEKDYNISINTAELIKLFSRN